MCFHYWSLERKCMSSQEPGSDSKTKFPSQIWGGMSLLPKTRSRKGLSRCEPKFYHLGLQINMWPSVGGLWEGRCHFMLRTSQQLAWLLLLSVLPGRKHLPLHLAYFVYREMWLVTSPIPSAEPCLTWCIPRSAGTLLMSVCTTGVCPSPQKQHTRSKELNQDTPSFGLVTSFFFHLQAVLGPDGADRGLGAVCATWWSSDHSALLRLLWAEHLLKTTNE